MKLGHVGVQAGRLAGPAGRLSTLGPIRTSRQHPAARTPAAPVVIRPEQLSEALDRIDPRDRELLALSLRRRVPDDDLARLYDCDPAAVSRRRAAAIERLADAMELQRGEDLGAVLRALLEPATWAGHESAVGEEFNVTASAGRPLAPVVDLSAERPSPPAASVGEPAAEGDGDPAGAASAAHEDGDAATETTPAAQENGDRATEPAPAARGTDQRPRVIPVSSEPVLEMLAAREREVPDPPRRSVALALAGLALAVLVAAAAVIVALQAGRGESRAGQAPDPRSPDDGTRTFLPTKGAPLVAPFPSDPETDACYATATISRATAIYSEPGGAKRLTLAPRTEWKSPRVLGVASQRGSWLGVQAPELRNGELGWIPRERAQVDCVRWSLHADLSKRVLFVRRDGVTVRELRVAVGRPENRTPVGRFSVTDKLRVTDPASVYGCCVLALTGHQTNLPEGWPGGDRLAVHATKDTSTIGDAVSLGCLRTNSSQARWLIDTIPLGTPVFIRS